MSATNVHRDERTVATENASYRWGYIVLAFGLLAVTAYRGFVRGEASWDLLALVIIAGIVITTFQGARDILNRRWAMVSVAATVIAAIVAAALLAMR
jgi:hypothetical protein